MSTWIVDRTPIAPHPFAHVVSNDEWVLISGIAGVGPTGELSEDPAQQARDAMHNLRARLEAAGSNLSEIVWFRVLASSREHLYIASAVVDEILPHPRPAGGGVTIGELAIPELKVEFEAWAHRGAVLTEQA